VRVPPLAYLGAAIACACNAITGVGDLRFDLAPEGGARDAGDARPSDVRTEAGCNQPPGDCAACQGQAHGGCECAGAFADCAADPDCERILNCVVSGESGVGPCDIGSRADADCVRACAAEHPEGRTLYLKTEQCLACGYCRAACQSGDYCERLAQP
jgi:hypothetical protein